MAAVTADLPGTYSGTFTASPTRTKCPPGDITIGPASKTLTFTATLTLDPSSISAKTLWTGMPPGISQSDITVAWNPPECVGRLEIAELVGTGGYAPPGNGTLDKQDDTLWRYTAFDEPQNELCAKDVKVWIAAMQGDEEVTRKSVIVWPVHMWWANVQGDFQKDYDYIRWKYATVLGTTGGAFNGPPTISTNACVPCGGGLDPPCVPACTHIDDTVDFGTSAFRQSETATASTIAHELVHTVGVYTGECAAYTWEVDHSQQTGIWLCDTAYLADVLAKQNCACSGCP